jgi:hypothetical protein
MSEEWAAKYRALEELAALRQENERLRVQCDDLTRRNDKLLADLATSREQTAAVLVKGQKATVQWISDARDVLQAYLRGPIQHDQALWDRTLSLHQHPPDASGEVSQLRTDLNTALATMEAHAQRADAAERERSEWRTAWEIAERNLTAGKELCAAAEREATSWKQSWDAENTRALVAEREVTKLRDETEKLRWALQIVKVNAAHSGGEWAEAWADQQLRLADDRAALSSPTTPAGEVKCNACDGPCEQPDERCLQCDGVNAGVWRFDGDDAICGQCGARWPKSKLSGAAPIEAPGKGDDDYATKVRRAQENSTMLFVGGSRESYRCDCGANVFTKLGGQRYRCNGCKVSFSGEPAHTIPTTEGKP